MGEGRVVRRGASEELGSQPVGHRWRLRARGDGAVAHGPQAGVLTRASRRAGVVTRGEHAGVGGHSQARPVVMGLQHGQTRRRIVRIGWRVVPMSVGAGIWRGPVAPQGRVPFTAMRGGQGEGASKLSMGVGRWTEGAGSRNEPPPCCEKRMLSN